MHEYSLTQSIIETVERHAAAAAENGESFTVRKINLVIGESSGIMGESIRLYFDIIAKGSNCENAVLEIESVKSMLRCKVCGALFERKPFSFECECGGEGAPTEIGREFYIKNIEVEMKECKPNLK